MAVPENPTVDCICTVGLQRGGQYNPSDDQITLAREEFLQEIKADIMRTAPFNRLLATTATTVTRRGRTRYAIPADHNQSLTLYLLDGPDEWRFTATDGGAAHITVPASFNETVETVGGKWLIILNGTGEGQYRQITNFNTSTRQLVPDTDFTTEPDDTSQVLIVKERHCLYPDNFDEFYNRNMVVEQNMGKPRRCAMFNQEFYLNPPAGSTRYGLVHHYYVDLSKVDEASPLFIQLLREWRSLWIQGLAAYTMQRYDDERFPQQWALYTGQLTRLAGDSPQYTQCEGHR